MNILVTGGAGFIGSHVAEAYLTAGHDVAIVDDLTTGRRENVPPSAAFYRCDVRSPELADVLADVQPHVVSHHAAQVSVSTSMDDPSLDASINVAGTARLLHQAAHHGVRRVILASSAAVYGDPAYTPSDEQHPLRPRSPYGASKRAAEIYARMAARAFGLRPTIFRYGNVYGPRQSAEGEAGVVAIFTRRMLDGAPTTVDGDGTQTRDFVYVGDVARANVLALGSGTAGVYNLGTGRATAIQTLWDSLRDIVGYAGEERHGPPRPGDIQHMLLSAKRAAWRLGWHPQVPLQTGLQLTVQSFRHAH